MGKSIADFSDERIDKARILLPSALSNTLRQTLHMRQSFGGGSEVFTHRAERFVHLEKMPYPRGLRRKLRLGDP
ncbi:hypothetical protein ATY81_20940 [Rhizobium sp. R72]|nr:hypothetical protein ATY81_20940 [Rhizobium sp. R72]OWW03197.1 hypothetical protein ATY80_20940 [Rhizobium sp. R711]